MAGQLHLLSRKLFQLKQELTHCLHRKSVTKRKVESLAGLLQFTAKVIRPGRSFLCQLYALQSIGSHPHHHHIRLNTTLRADISWWFLFAEHWNGISMLWDSHLLSPQFIMFSDASGYWGCGAVWMTQWFHLKWPAQFQALSIVVKEFIPVVLAAAIFGRQWQGHLIQFSVDNMLVVHILNSTYSKDPHLMHMIQVLVFLAAHTFGSEQNTLRENLTLLQMLCLATNRNTSYLIWNSPVRYPSLPHGSIGIGCLLGGFPHSELY